jgi:transcriptional regulator with XRE-family HTH domain
MSQTVRFDVAQMQQDIAAKGWQPADLADRAGVARSTVSRFLNGEFQTARMAKRLAEALGYSVRRYIVRNEEERVPA